MNTIHTPEAWFFVRFRQICSFEQITGYMTCKNAYHAGHAGWSRKKRRGRRVARVWDLRDYTNRRLAYKFADLADLRKAIKSDLIQNWMKLNEGILEVVAVQGCRHNGKVLNEKVLDRFFGTENAMEILALEYGLGE